MARQSFSYTHGDTGTKPTSSLNFEANERPVAGNFDWYWYNVTEAISGHASEFDRLDADDDGIVDETDTVTPGGNLKGDLQAVDGEVIWDESATYIPQGRLQNDSITVSAGTGLNGGGTVALGNTVNVSVDDSRYVLESGDTMGGALDMGGYAIKDGVGALTLSGAVEAPDGTFTVGGSSVLTTADEGAGNGIDADTLDGGHASDIGVVVEKDGTSLVDPATGIDFVGGMNVSDDGDGTVSVAPDDAVAFEPGHTQWGSGLSDKEIYRVQLQAGETFEVERLEFQQRGGGSSSNASIDVYDATAATVIGSTNLGSVNLDVGESNAGNVILVRLTNGTGAGIKAAPRVVGHINGA